MTLDLIDEASRILAETCITIIGAGGAGERIVLLAQANELGINRYDVVCDRCHSRPMTLGAFITTHYAQTETAHREAVRKANELGPEPGAWATLNPGLHKPGDGRLAFLSELARPNTLIPEPGTHINPSGLA